MIATLDASGAGVSGNSSDGALLLAAYRAFGTDCVEHLRGDFAFALWDSKNQRLLLARDHFGIKPLFYAKRGDALVACSDIGAIRLWPLVGDALDDQAMAEFLATGFFMALDATAFGDIRRLPPAHTLVFENGKARARRYWTLPVPEQLRCRNPSDYVEHFRHVLECAVTDRVRDESVGIHLSGGLDSAVIAAAVKSSGERVRMRGYTVVFDELIPDEERRYATATSRYLDFPVEFLNADGFLPYANWDKTPEPIHDPFFFNQRAQYRDLLGHARAALSGHGGDELLLGSYVADLVGRMPLARLFKDLLGSLFIHHVRPPIGLRTVWRRRRLGPSPGRLPPAWLREALVERFELKRRVGELTADWAASPHPLRPQAHRYLASAIWPAIFEQEDANFTGVPVDVRYPFFDLGVVEFLLALPPLPWCVDKHIARRAMLNRLPDTVRIRPKAPVAGNVLRAHLRESRGQRMPDFTLPPALNCYINKDKLPPVHDLLESADLLWLRLAPVSLGLWLEHNGLATSDSRDSNHETDRTQQNAVSARETTVP